MDPNKTEFFEINCLVIDLRKPGKIFQVHDRNKETGSVFLVETETLPGKNQSGFYCGLHNQKYLMRYGV